MHFSLSLHKLVHLVWVAIVFLKAKLLVDVFVFGKSVVDMLHAFHHVFLHGFCLVEWRVLRQVSHGVARAPYHFALSGLFKSGNDFHQCRLSGAVKTDDTYFCSVEEREVDVLQDLLLILWDDFRYSHH